MIETIPAAGDSRRQAIHRSLGGLLAIALLGALACSSGSDSSTGPESANLAGIYSLRTVDGKPIPMEVFRGSYYDPDLDAVIDPLIVKITGGEVILSDDGSYHIAVDVATIGNGAEDRSSASGDGTYEITGTDITLQGPGGTVRGTLRKGDITLDIPAQGTVRRYFFRFVP